MTHLAGQPAFHDDLLPDRPAAGTLGELLAGELVGGDGCPEWRDWVARAAVRHRVAAAV